MLFFFVFFEYWFCAFWTIISLIFTVFFMQIDLKCFKCGVFAVSAHFGHVFATQEMIFIRILPILISSNQRYHNLTLGVLTFYFKSLWIIRLRLLKLIIHAFLAWTLESVHVSHFYHAYFTKLDITQLSLTIFIDAFSRFDHCLITNSTLKI